MKRALLVISVFALLFNTLSAQYLLPKTKFALNIDYSRFRFSADSSYLEVYYAAYPSNVTLEKTRDTLWGSVIFYTKIIDIEKNSLVARSSVSMPIFANDTAALKAGYIGKSIYALPSGYYELFIQGYDGKDTVRQDSVRKRFTITRDSSGAPFVSDIDLCSRVIQSENKASPFFRNSYEVIPNPSLLFGAQVAPVAFSYAELYNLNPDSTYLIVIGVTDGKGNLIKQRRQVRRFSARNVVDVNTLNVNSIPSGKYRFMLFLADTLGNEIAHSEKPIFIHNPQIASTTAFTAISAKGAEFAGLTDDELIDEFRKAKYIANSEATKTFEKITTTDGRREFLAKFWADVEKGLYGREDMTRNLYLERVAIAIQRYRAMGKDGWLSNRGRVYILYGEPDEIQRFPNQGDSKPYEIWHYHKIENVVQFVFVDRAGFGDYTLVHSTKRSEIYDESWQRYLR